MAKRIMAKIGTYTKDGEQKGKYVEVGVILDNQYGECALLHPHVDLSGLLIQQRLLDPKKAGKSVLCSIFDNDNRSSESPSHAPAPDSDFDDDIPFS